MCSHRPTSLFNQLAELVSLWWQRDRIRVSPREGRLLRLTPGTIVIVAGERYEVTARSVVQSDCETPLHYALHGLAGPAELRVGMTPENGLCLIDDRGGRELTRDELEVWG